MRKKLQCDGLFSVEKPRVSWDEMRKRWRIECAMRAEMTALTTSRTRKIMIAGSLLCFGMPFAAWAGIDFLEGVRYRQDAMIATTAVLVLMPAAIGSLIAFFGRMVPAESWDVAEWGLVRPSKCFFIGWVLYLPFAIVPYIFFLVLVVWLLLVAGAAVTASIFRLAGRSG